VRALIQGTVTLDAIVGIDGKISEVRVRKSLDPDLGLDHEAVAAVQQWRFSPATRFGEPVPLRVSVELFFS
jgi:TonB family protein